MTKGYDEVSGDLRRRVRAGEFPPGDRLPDEAALATEYGVGLPALRQALADLRTEGLIGNEDGRGTFVRGHRQRAERSNLRHQWEKDRARADPAERKRTGATEQDTGLTTGQLAFQAEYERIEAPEELAAALNLDPGDAVLKRTYRTRSADEEEPLKVARSYIPYEIARQNPDLLDAAREPWPGGTMNQLHTVGIEIDRVEEVVTARSPTPQESEELGLAPGAAVMDVRKTLHDTDGRIVEVADVVLPGDRYAVKCVTTLERW
ncbi:UTRA domain-containing protein [Streptomyces sp. PRKS01-65]|nr:GntR family transcriptional regulator [Streptomyces harenosi]NEY34260.1 UTRA domain-containing protein [Streptomyces harenosi]